MQREENTHGSVHRFNHIFLRADLRPVDLRAVRESVRTFKHRREIKALTELDDRLLKDIGLTRGDVAGALSVPLLSNPSAVLVRSVERRSRSRRGRSSATADPPMVPVVSRPARTCA